MMNNLISASFKALMSVVVLSISLLPAAANANDFLSIVEQQRLTETKEYLLALSDMQRTKTLETPFSNGDKALIYAARQQNIALFDLLIELGANPNAMDTHRRDVINIAIKHKNIELAKRAIEAGTDVTMVTSQFEGSALIYASHQAQVEIVNMLIAAGAPLDRVNNVGWTALLEATVLGDGSKPYQEIVDALIAAGADQSIADSEGITPLQHATRRGHTEIVTILSQP